MKEELDANFEFQKILYIREFIKPNDEEHNLELFILGKINKYVVKQNSQNPDYKETHKFKWVDIDKLPDNLYPITLTPKLIKSFKAGFPNQGEYLGAVE